MYHRCEKCGFDIRHNMLKKHVEVCDGRGPKYRREKITVEKRSERIKTKWQEASWDKVPKYRRRDRVMMEQNGLCLGCSSPPVWLGRPLKFQLDHINGNSSDNERSNLRLLCPNCHAQTETWGHANASPEGIERMKDAARRGRMKRNMPA